MERVKWGVMGTAFICRRSTLPGMLQAENCELYAIAGRSREKAEQFQKEYGFAVCYDSYDELLDDPAVQAVYIPLPNTMHYEWTIKALKKGKHVLCEKPLASTAEQAAQMFRTARENGVLLMEAFAYQHSPYIAAIRQEIEDGTIGELQYMESAYMTSDYDLQNIRMRKETLGGCTYDLGVYNTSLILRLLGQEPEQVHASACFSAQGVDKLTSVVLEFSGGLRASFTCGMVLATEQERHIDRFTVCGSKGSISGDRFEFNGDGDLSYMITLADGTKTVRHISTPQNYRLEVEQLGRCILCGEQPAVTEAFSMANARLVDRILQEIGY